VALLAGSWGLKYQVLVTFTKGTEVEHVFFIETGPVAVPDRPERSTGGSRRVDFPSSIQRLIPSIWAQSKAVRKEMARDALTGILDGNFQIKVK
jgi:hypothetical protein